MNLRAIIIKKEPLREYDEYVTCFTRYEGKQRYQVKSINRPSSIQARHVDLLNVIDYCAINANRAPIMASAHCVESFLAIKKILPALAVSFFILECFDKFVYEGQYDNRLWLYLVNFLHQTNENSLREKIDWRIFMAAQYREFSEVMGYSRNLPAQELYHSPFKSLQFCDAVLH